MSLVSIRYSIAFEKFSVVSHFTRHLRCARPKGRAHFPGAAGRSGRTDPHPLLIPAPLASSLPFNLQASLGLSVDVVPEGFADDNNGGCGLCCRHWGIVPEKPVFECVCVYSINTSETCCMSVMLFMLEVCYMSVLWLLRRTCGVIRYCVFLRR